MKNQLKKTSGKKEEDFIDQYGRMLCQKCLEPLNLFGVWRFNGRIYPDKFEFRCPKCGSGFLGGAEEVNLHQDGIVAAKEYQDVLNKKAAVVQFIEREKNKNSDIKPVSI
jgi:Zn finger protein HypA/HybF involved in hydrogenase expression